MTVKEYTEACLKFAAASQGWVQVDETQFITTHDGSWEMTADNKNGAAKADGLFSAGDRAGGGRRAGDDGGCDDGARSHAAGYLQPCGSKVKAVC